jgi:hypothetical protein
MAKFLITYTAGAQPGDMSDEMSQQVMEAWNKWYADLGDAVVDFGNPTGGSKTIIPGGVVQDGTSGITGYSLIEVDSLDAAAEACRNHPHLEAGGTITVHETFEVGPQS